MGAAIVTHIYCDGCGVTYGVDMSHRNATEHRRFMREDGWLYSGNRDYCPYCRSKTKAGANRKSINRKHQKGGYPMKEKQPPKCKHKKKELGYLQWHAMAEKKTKAGEKQKQCPVCKLWFFKHEF